MVLTPYYYWFLVDIKVEGLYAGLNMGQFDSEFMTITATNPYPIRWSLYTGTD